MSAETLLSLNLGRGLGIPWGLLVAQSEHRIDPRRSAGRDVAGPERDQREQHRNGRERDWIGDADSKQQASHQPRDGQRTGDTDRNSCCDDDQRLPDDDLSTSDAIVPPADLTLEETRRLFSGDGLIPDLPAA